VTQAGWACPGRSGHALESGSGKKNIMRRTFTLEYWQDEDWYVRQLRKVPGVFSQGETLTELEENIRDAFELVLEDSGKPVFRTVQQKEIEVEV
jgi:predicted RNase H-like HicB family nuclease